MRGFLGRIFDRFRSRPGKGFRLSDVLEVRQGDLAPGGLQHVIAACHDLQDGEACGPDIYRLLGEEMRARRVVTGTLSGPENPELSGLVVRRSGLPPWWEEGGNLLLAAPGVAAEVVATLLPFVAPPAGCVVVIGSDAKPGQCTFAGSGGLMVIGDRAVLPNAHLSVRGQSTILIGEDANALSPAHAAASNGGIVIIGADALWAAGVLILTDDFHAIRDRQTGRRVNVFGGRVVVDRHVWLGVGVNLLGDCFVARDCVVGMGSLVKSVAVPPNSIAAGRPATVVRENIVWSLDDLP